MRLQDEAKLHKAAEAAAVKEKRAQQVRGHKKAMTRATGPARTTSPAVAPEDDSEVNVIVRPRPHLRPVWTVVVGDGVIDVSAAIRDPVRRSTRPWNTVDGSWRHVCALSVEGNDDKWWLTLIDWSLGIYGAVQLVTTNFVQWLCSTTTAQNRSSRNQIREN